MALRWLLGKHECIAARVVGPIRLSVLMPLPLLLWYAFLIIGQKCIRLSVQGLWPAVNVLYMAYLLACASSSVPYRLVTRPLMSGCSC